MCSLVGYQFDSVCGYEANGGMADVEAPHCAEPRVKPHPVPPALRQAPTRREDSDASGDTAISVIQSQADDQDSENGPESRLDYYNAMQSSLLYCAKDKITCEKVQSLMGAELGFRILAKNFQGTQQPFRRHSDDWVGQPTGWYLDVVGDPRAELIVGIKESPGYRSKMEDRTCVREKFMTVKTLVRKTESLIPSPLQKSLDSLTAQSKTDLAMYESEPTYIISLPFDFAAVFDGHGGAEVAEKLAADLSEFIKDSVLNKQKEIDAGEKGVSPGRMLQTRADYSSGQATVSSLCSSVRKNHAGWAKRQSSLHDSFGSRAGDDIDVHMDVDPSHGKSITPIREDSSSGDFSDVDIDHRQALCLKEVEEGIEEAFIKFNNSLPEIQDRTVGSTAVVSMISAMHIMIANVGDSRAVLRRNGMSFRLSRDHKPDQQDEEDRIRECGGRIWDFNGRRVMGLLAMTRAFGDDCLKAFGIISKPEVTIIPRSDEDEFLILACDGLWDVVSDEEACQLVQRCFKRAEEREASPVSACRVAASVLFRAAFAKGSNDNISVVVIDLRQENADNN